MRHLPKLLCCVAACLLLAADDPRQTPPDRPSPARKFNPKRRPKFIVSRPKRPATVEVENMTSTAVSPEGDWAQIPSALFPGKVYSVVQKESPVCRFKVTGDGVVFLAASWNPEGRVPEAGVASLWTMHKVIESGWTPLGYWDRKLENGALDRHLLFYREAKAGEAYSIRTRLRSPPLVALGDARAAGRALGFVKSMGSFMDGIADLPPLVKNAGSNDFGTFMSTDRIVINGPRPLVGGQLHRELARQAVLIAARDELGLSTRDASLRASFPQQADAANSPLEATTIFEPRDMRVTFSQREKGSPALAWLDWMPLPEENQYEYLVKRMEAVSKQWLPWELHGLGFKGNGNQIVDSGEVAQSAARLQDEMNFLVQFAVVQIVHRQIQREGESPQRLAALARAYANLGMLINFTTSPARKACYARSLLYAQRHAARWPQDPLGRWSLGYAWAIVGRHATAIGEFERAAQTAKSDVDDDVEIRAPGWARLAEAYCRYQPDKLKSAMDHAQFGPLARVLWLLTNTGYNEQPLRLSAAERVLETTPDCFLALDSLVKDAQLGEARQAMYRSLGVAATSIYSRLRSIPQLPETVARIVHEDRAETDDVEEPVEREMVRRAELIEALREADSSAEEPGWDVLGSLIEDLSFMHAAREADLLAYRLSVPVDGALPKWAPLLRNHPFWLALVYRSDDPRISRRAKDLLLKSLDPVHFNSPAWNVMHELTARFETETNHLTSVLGHQEDRIFADQDVDRRRPDEHRKPRFVDQLRAFAPHMPATVAWAMEMDDELAEADITALANRYRDVPEVLLGLGKRWARKKEYDRAAQSLRRHISLAPTFDAYVELADVYKSQGDIGRWQETLLEYLEKGNIQGLQSAQVQHKIAEHFMNLRQWRKALPYAEQAAESGAGWAMRAAGECHEALQNWDQAESYYKAISARYGNSVLEWYFFCERTGQGDIEAARRIAAQWVNSVEQGRAEPVLVPLGIYYLLTKDPARAIEPLRQSAEQYANPRIWLLAALAADRAAQSEVRDTLLEKCREAGRKMIARYTSPVRSIDAELAEQFQTDLAKGGSGELDHDKINEIINAEEPVFVTGYAVGAYLSQRKQDDRAVRYWRHTMAGRPLEHFLRTLAGAELLDRGIIPDDYRDAVHGKVGASEPEE